MAGGNAMDDVDPDQHGAGASRGGKQKASFDCSVELKVDPSAPRSYAITVELM
jgi:hypothetical protein